MTEIAISSRRYRWLDRASKLGGLALIAAGLDVGGTTLAGIALALAGTALGLLTVFVAKQ